MKDGTVSVAFLHPGEYKACFGRSLRDLLFADAFGQQRITSHQFGEIGLEIGSGELVVGRNKVAQTFMDSDVEWLFMVDSDMGFAPDTVERLLDAADPVERPVVGALAFACKSNGSGPFGARRYKASPTLYTMAQFGDTTGFLPMFDYPRDALVEVDATGAACMLVHRNVIETVSDKYGPVWFERLAKPGAPVGEAPFGEDMSFCLRVKAAGFPIFVHTGVKTTHDKGALFLDEETYDVQRRAEAGGG